MYIWPDKMEMLRLNNAGDRLYLKHLYDGTIVIGAKGSSKTTATGAHLHAGLLETQCGGVVSCPKPTDCRDYMRLIERHRREKDVILMRPTKEWTETPMNAINVLAAEQKLFGRGKSSVTNITTMLMKIADLIQRRGGKAAAGGDSAFWVQFAEKLIRSGLTVQSILSDSFDLKNLLKFITTLPNTPEQAENQNLYAVAQLQQAAAKVGENPPFEFTSVWDFCMHDWAQAPPNSRGSGVLTVQVLLDTLLSHEIRKLLFEDTTFDLGQVLNHGGILLLDMDVQNYPLTGAIVGMVLKDLVSRACQARSELSTLEPKLVQPVYLLYDEYPEYAVDSDEAHARTARSARLIPIFITQSTTSLKAQFHDKDKAQALLDLAGCRWAHNNGSFETNEWMAKTIGQVIVKRRGDQEGTNLNFGPQFQHGRNHGHNYNEAKDFDCDPRLFTRLLRGGVENKLKAEAILWRNGDRFRWNQRRYLPVAFRQDFKPGYDEVRVTARAMTEGGKNRVQKFAANFLNSASEIGRQRLRSLYR